ncbi:MAG: hypothetical protein COV07_00420 [Candidatus Vogelbacteria bacterium CG10_big_fil_rev_8_21_14_0_10_45_14]|uniref:Blue (type 1) copper domain-containing protein n=1 Tax=Candidatus Vogelbacteria bacterium CG10_big_fil_rev_8_21_14_0_10_45_14 TaxID=1975042 RepID=A0A2H0RL23_9BACT|nr:MAG: hypothetical protein COV07_00420 [Candidatus Vogelbacteria bacterium CG10_big_fil_rev_8_21_14_0_10_45_14]
MRIFTRFIGLSLLVILSLPGQVGAQVSDQAQVAIRDGEFVPSSITVYVGTQVFWTNYDFEVHNIVSEDGLFASANLERGYTFSRRFTKAGSYPYYSNASVPRGGSVTRGTVNVVNNPDAETAPANPSPSLTLTPRSSSIPSEPLTPKVKFNLPVYDPSAVFYPLQLQSDYTTWKYHEPYDSHSNHSLYLTGQAHPRCAYTTYGPLCF